jgi:hypothetical protein
MLSSSCVCPARTYYFRDRFFRFALGFASANFAAVVSSRGRLRK